MNIKEAYRYQGQYQFLIENAERILANEACITTVEATCLKSKAIDGAEDVTEVKKPETQFSEHITQMVEFVFYLLEEKEKLTNIIRGAKANLPIDMDAEVALNAQRRDIAKALEQMDIVKDSEMVIPNGGSCYGFNVDGNPVQYRCDVRQVKKIAFDRKTVHKRLAEIYQKIDTASAQLDQCMINTEVDYNPPIDVNDNFSRTFCNYCEMEEV